MAAYFSSLGFEVALYAREQERVDMFHSNRFIMSGAKNGTAYVNIISCNMAKVIEGAPLIMVTTPAQYHSSVARDMSPYLAEGQIVLLNPGRTFGTLEFAKTLRENACNKYILLAEADTLAFTCRVTQIGYPVIHSIKDNVRVAAHRPEDTGEVLQALSAVLPCFRPAKSILHTGLTNIGMVFHPLPFIMNFTRIENSERFLHYHEGITPLVAELLELLDMERMEVAKALGISVPSAKEWIFDRYGSYGVNLYEAIQNTAAYGGVYAPTNIYSRYIFEDIPTGCVPLCCVGKRLGVKTPIAKALINWSSAVYGFDFMERGRNDTKIDLSFID
jgi:opine dehydrogenase